MTTGATATQIFYPSVLGGKYHRANVITDTAACGSPVVLDTDDYGSIHHTAGERAHPMLCKKCLRAG